MSGIMLGSIISFFIFAFFIMNIDSYINFMNMDIDNYKDFAIYAIIQLYIQLIFNFYIEKLYYEEKNTLANKYSLGFNMLNFIVLVITSLVFRSNHFLIICITLRAISIYTMVVIIRQSNYFKIEFKLLKYIKYDSVELFKSVIFFFIFLLGVNQVLEYGEAYATAFAFISLITDTQEDVYSAIVVSSKIDIAKNNFNYKEHLKNAYKLLGLLILSICTMFLLLFNLYDLNINIVIILLSIKLINLLIYSL